MPDATRKSEKVKYGSTLIRILTLTCDDSTRLVSESLDRRLPLGERLAVRLHALCCRSCRRAGRQLRFLHEAMTRRAEQENAGKTADLALSNETRARITAMLDQQSRE